MFVYLMPYYVCLSNALLCLYLMSYYVCLSNALLRLTMFAYLYAFALYLYNAVLINSNKLIHNTFSFLHYYKIANLFKKIIRNYAYSC